MICLHSFTHLIIQNTCEQIVDAHVCAHTSLPNINKVTSQLCNYCTKECAEHCVHFVYMFVHLKTKPSKDQLELLAPVGLLLLRLYYHSVVGIHSTTLQIVSLACRGFSLSLREERDHHKSSCHTPFIVHSSAAGNGTRHGSSAFVPTWLFSFISL